MTIENFNGSRLKVKEKEVQIASPEGDTTFQYFEIISPHNIAQIAYMTRNGKVVCLK